MKKALLTLLILAGLLGLSPAINAQKPKAKTAPPDEALFDKWEYTLLDGRAGWRRAAISAEDSEGEQRFYYDPSRITAKSKSVKHAWIKAEDWKDKRLIAYELHLVEYDCAGSKMRILEAAHYDDGLVLDRNQSTKEVGQWTRVVPESTGETVFGIICLNQPDPERHEMDVAAMWFQMGRQAEKRGDFKMADLFYNNALESASDNTKILAAIKRVNGSHKP